MKPTKWGTGDENQNAPDEAAASHAFYLSSVEIPVGGGANCVLAETLGSCLSVLHVDTEKVVPVGTNINSNHLRSKKDGMVTGTARFIRKGNTMHVSEIDIRDEHGHLINHTTMTNNIIPRPR